MSNRAKSNFAMIMAALIWGTAFVAQKQASNIGPFTYTGIRMLVGAVTLTIIIYFLERNHDDRAKEETRKNHKKTMQGGFLCGLFMFIATVLQQAGLRYIPAGKSGFLTAIYTVIVPIIAIAIGKKVRPIVWLGAILCVAGLYLLCMTGVDGGSFNRGDIMTLACAFCYALQIICIDYFSKELDGPRLSRMQAFTAGVLGIIAMILFETPVLSEILGAWVSILYVGIFSTGIAYTLQIVGQKYSPPTEATIILSLESVFSVIAGAIILHEIMGPLQYLGCALIFIAVLISQMPERNKLKA